MNCIFEIREFEALPEPAKHSLWFLRGLRDAMADYLISNTDDEELIEEIENLCRYLYARPGWLKERLTQSLLCGCSKGYFEVLWFIIRRIARMEREAIPGYYIERELLTA